MMALFDFKKITFTLAFGFAILIAGTADVNAQSRRDIERERQRVERENARYQTEQRRYRSNRNAPAVNRRTVANANYSNGYQQGLLAGQYDRRKNKYNQSNVYRGTGSNPNQGDPTSSDYIYRQGYLQGYNDGFNGTRNY